MNTPSSIAAALPQPESARYSTDALALFKTYTRDSYFTEFGVQAPAWDPARPPKAWFDSSASANISQATKTYSILGQQSDGTWTLQSMTLTAAEAAAVNLPGAVEYPQYRPASTRTTRAGQSINPIYMVLEDDARAVMTEVGGTGLFDEGALSRNAVSYPKASYPADEQRRIWAFQVNGQQYFAGLLLASKYGLGVGWPGRWDFSRGYPLWVSDPPPPTGIADSRPPVPAPVRTLLPSERLQAGPMGIGVVVARLDLEEASAAGGFTPADRAMLQKILEVLQSK
ncbi:MAG: hypothetical protein ABL967_14235 [Bryobacteraceae bacterium]